MTDQPYTHADLRTEASKQHYALVDHRTYSGIGESMTCSTITSTGQPWEDLDEKDFAAAQSAIDDLLIEAVDTSAWAVEMGAADIEPGDTNIRLPWAGQHAQIFLGFSVGMSAADRAALVAQIRAATA